MLKILFLLSSVVILFSSCASYIPPIDPQFSCQNEYSRGKVLLKGNDPKHTAYGYCRKGMKQKNFIYSYEGVSYMKVKYKNNIETKCSCLNPNGQWYASTEASCRKAYGRL